VRQIPSDRKRGRWSEAGPAPLDENDPMPSISPFPWFDSGAEEAARFYVGPFPDPRIVTITRYGLSWQVNPPALGEMPADP
jgi:predicted 3-demethylubiquinone-9 3-methyltransferase (glyoxalase superfamily)